MTADEVRDAFPAAAAEIEAEGRRAERERIRACWELASDVGGRIGDEVRDRALGDDAPTAAELAREVKERDLLIETRGGFPRRSSPIAEG